MAFSRTWLQYICGLLFFVSSISALKFDLEAKHGKNERCIRNFVAKDTLVVVTATVDGRKGDGMVVNINVRLFPLRDTTPSVVAAVSSKEWTEG
jgi:p24 family protein delta-1